MRRLFISDVHIGSEECRAAALLYVLKNYSYDLLVIVGDLFENGGKVMGDQPQLIDYLMANRHRIFYVFGNHDDHAIAEMLGMKCVKTYEWQTKKREKCCAIHGHHVHRFCFIFNAPWIDKLFSSFIWLLRKINIFGFSLSKWLDNRHQEFSNGILKSLKEWARRLKIKRLVYGHTHIPLHEKDGALEFVNCGNWVTDTCSFVVEDDDKIELCIVALRK